MKVKIQLDDNEPFEIEFHEQAIDLVQFKFNPSGDKEVNEIKTLTCALMSKLSTLRGAGSFEFENAVQYVQTASMWSVLTATKGL